MKLTGLIPLYRNLIEKNSTYCVFTYTKNNIDFDVFFDIGCDPFKLGFLIIKSEFQLWIDVHKGFIINTKLHQKDYLNLINILGIKYDPTNKFSTNQFFEEFNNRIPTNFRKKNKNDLIKLIRRAYEIEDDDKIYYKGLIDWDKSTTRNRRYKNLEKTRLLYPGLYNQIKNRNISVIYTANKNESEDVKLKKILK